MAGMRGGKGPKERPWSHPDRQWEVRDAMHTLLRAGEITRDKKLLGEVRKHAAKHAAEMQDVARQAGALARAGKISPKQLAKLTKTAPTA